MSVGVGRAFSAAYLARPNTTLIGAARNHQDETLATLQRRDGNKLIIIKIDSGSEINAKNAIELLKTKNGISKLDAVSAHAGIGYYRNTALKTSVKELQEYYFVNRSHW